MLTRGIRKVCFCALIALVLLSWGGTQAEESRRVTRVHDGDTITLDGGTRVRYLGLNAPEIDYEKHTAAPFACQARELNENLVLGRIVRLEMDHRTKDRFGRTLGYVFLPDGRFVNQQLLAEGLAFCLPDNQNRRYQEVLLKAQRAAMEAGRGMWTDWRETENAVYHGSRASRRFHAAACPFAVRIRPRNRVLFQSQWKAYWEGFAPCKQCLGGK